MRRPRRRRGPKTSVRRRVIAMRPPSSKAPSSLVHPGLAAPEKPSPHETSSVGGAVMDLGSEISDRGSLIPRSAGRRRAPCHDPRSCVVVARRWARSPAGNHDSALTNIARRCIVRLLGAAISGTRRSPRDRPEHRRPARRLDAASRRPTLAAPDRPRREGAGHRRADVLRRCHVAGRRTAHRPGLRLHELRRGRAHGARRLPAGGHQRPAAEISLAESR